MSSSWNFKNQRHWKVASVRIWRFHKYYCQLQLNWKKTRNLLHLQDFKVFKFSLLTHTRRIWISRSSKRLFIMYISAIDVRSNTVLSNQFHICWYTWILLVWHVSANNNAIPRETKDTKSIQCQNIPSSKMSPLIFNGQCAQKCQVFQIVSQLHKKWSICKIINLILFFINFVILIATKIVFLCFNKRWNKQDHRK